MIRRLLWCVVAVLAAGPWGASWALAQQDPSSGGFSDLGDTYEGFVEPLRALEAQGVLTGTGCGDGRLCPDEPLARWEMAVWLVRVLDGADPDPAAQTRFEDVDPGSWWAPHVERLAHLEITVGCGTDRPSYCPHGSVDRAQTAAFLVRAFELDAAPGAGFEDTVGSYAAAHIDSVYAAGITTGCSSQALLYCPERATTRAQMATFIHRAQTNNTNTQDSTPAGGAGGGTAGGNTGGGTAGGGGGNTPKTQQPQQTQPQQTQPQQTQPQQTQPQQTQPQQTQPQQTQPQQTQPQQTQPQQTQPQQLDASDSTLNSLSVTVFPGTTGGALGAQAPATWSCGGPASTHDGVSRDAASSGQVDIGEFSRSHLAYSGTVTSGVQDVTIDAHSTNPGATVTVCPWDRHRARPDQGSFWEDVYRGHQVGLRRGDNRFTVTVESADGTETSTYTLNILREPQTIDWADYFAVWVDLAFDHTRTNGVWSNDTTMWFVDPATDRLVAYTLQNLARDPDKDVTLIADSNPRGVWSDGTTIWVARPSPAAIYAYDLSTRSRSSTKEVFNLSALGSNGIGGIWSDGATMWVTPAQANGNTRVYAFDMASGNHKPDAELVLQGLPAGLHLWKGMWSDGVTLFNVDLRDRAVYAHDLASGARVGNVEFLGLFGGSGSSLLPVGIWSNGATMWVTETATSDGYAGRVPYGARHVAAFRMKADYTKPSAAALRSITLNGSALDGFSHSNLSPQAEVPNTTASVTVGATAALASANVTITPSDADTTADGHQIDLDVGENTVTLQIISGEAEATYSMTVTRRSP